MGEIFIGCAGWAISTSLSSEFPPPGTHLERYARRFEAVELNSCFYRPHQKKTYERWAASTPEHFRFALKVPKLITHERRLAEPTEPLERYLAETSGLGDKRAVLLVQLPPSLFLDEPVARAFFTELRKRYSGKIAVEPRHASWFGKTADRLYFDFALARVAADPAKIAGAGRPGGDESFVYYRLHGSPRMYYSSYSEEYLRAVAEALERYPESWCIFDNTAEGAAIPNALATRRFLDNHLQPVLAQVAILPSKH